MVAPLACDGCLGTQTCWVCLGTGNANTEERLGVCARCRGSARCTLCQPVPARAIIPEQGGRPVREDYADGEAIPLAPYTAG